MITAKEIRKEIETYETQKNQKAEQQATEWCEGLVATCIRNAAKDNETRIDLCACDLDDKGCKFAYEILTQAGYKVRRNGGHFFTIEW